MSYAKEDVFRMVREEDVQFIRMQFTDIFGQLKNVAVTASQIERAVNNEIMLDGSSIEGYVRIQESDQYLWPDLDTFAVLPWRPQYGKVARLICDVHLFQTDERGRPTTETSDEAGYFDLGPLDHGESTRREVCLSLEEMGMQIEASHHELAPGQHEIDLKYVDALQAADNIMTFKLAVKTLAQKNGLHATFMPKPVSGTAGSGMHVNMSLFRNGRNVFFDENAPGQLSELARQFMAGLLAHARGFCALTNPLVNSYKRLLTGYEAPCYLAWSSSNRSSLIRIPAPRGQGTRVELRNPDPACNPYLVFAACLAAGLDGIEHGLTPPPEVTENIYAMSDADRAARNITNLPVNLAGALCTLEGDPVITEALGEHVTRQYTEGKRREWEEYRAQVSQWELSRYLVTY